MMFNATFNNISIISWWDSFIGGVRNWRKPPDSNRFSTLVVIGTDCI
jgi:hypothetical protein